MSKMSISKNEYCSMYHSNFFLIVNELGEKKITSQIFGDSEVPNQNGKNNFFPDSENNT